MALSTARMHKVRGRPPLLAAGISSLIHSHSSSVRSLGYVFSFIFPFYTTHEDFSDRLSGRPYIVVTNFLPPRSRGWSCGTSRRILRVLTSSRRRPHEAFVTSSTALASRYRP